MVLYWFPYYHSAEDEESSISRSANFFDLMFTDGLDQDFLNAYKWRESYSVTKGPGFAFEGTIPTSVKDDVVVNDNRKGVFTNLGAFDIYDPSYMFTNSNLYRTHLTDDIFPGK